MAFPTLPKGHAYNGMIELGFDQDDEGLNAHLYTENLHMRSVVVDDIPYYQDLFADPRTMSLFATGATKTPEQTAERVMGWVKRWHQGNPYSAFALFDRETDVFIGHMISGGGEDTHYDDTPDAGYSEMAFLLRQEMWGKGHGKQGAAAIVKKFVPWMQEHEYKVATDVEDKVVQRPLVWLTATARLGQNEEGKFLNEASIRILTGLDFECKTTGEKFGHYRGYFGLKV